MAPMRDAVNDIEDKPMKRISVAVDAMGGDKAPCAIVTGAVAAARKLPAVDIILIGDDAVVRSCLAQYATGQSDAAARRGDNRDV
jgi:fatty acid/phospholipid biosynthesis enzyme